jgi:hypothetical protein
MTRRDLIAELAGKLHASEPCALMDALQNEGLVSDCAVSIEDVPTSDLERAVISVRRVPHQRAA